MKTQLTSLESDAYRALLWRIKCRLSQFYGSQRKVAKHLGIDPANLSRILSGVTDCNSKLLFQLLNIVGMVIIANDIHFDGFPRFKDSIDCDSGRVVSRPVEYGND